MLLIELMKGKRSVYVLLSFEVSKKNICISVYIRVKKY